MHYTHVEKLTEQDDLHNCLHLAAKQHLHINSVTNKPYQTRIPRRHDLSTRDCVCKPQSPHIPIGGIQNGGIRMNDAYLVPVYTRSRVQSAQLQRHLLHMCRTPNARPGKHT
jgi:hypothetical protein